MSARIAAPDNSDPKRPGRGEPGSRTAIFVNPSLSKLLKGAGNFSGRLDNIARRMALLTDLLVPRLSVDEWAFVVLALRAGPAETEVDSALLAWGHLYGDQAAEAWGVDSFELIVKLEAVEPAGKVILCEVVERYWQYESLASVGHADRLQHMRLITAGEAMAWKRAAPHRAEAIRRASGEEG